MLTDWHRAFSPFTHGTGVIVVGTVNQLAQRSLPYQLMSARPRSRHPEPAPPQQRGVAWSRDPPARRRRHR